MDFIGYNEQEMEAPPGICETEQELEEAVDYITSQVDIQNEKRLFNYGKSHLKSSGGLTIDTLLTDTNKIKIQEQNYRKDRHEPERRKNENEWFRL